MPLFLISSSVGAGSGQEALNLPVLAVAFAEVRVLHREGAVVVERRAPQHPAVSHHALLHPHHFALMAFAAGQVGGAEIAGVDEADVFVAFLIPNRVETHGIFRFLFFEDARLDVGFLLVRCLGRVAAVTIGAADVQILVAVDVHRLLFVAGVANHAPHAPRVLQGLLRLAEPAALLSLPLCGRRLQMMSPRSWCSTSPG